MNELLSQAKAQQIPHHFPLSDDTLAETIIQPHFLSEAVFAGGSFWYLEAAFGRVYGVVKTATGYCGGTWKKPTYSEVCEGRTGHTEAVKVIFDNTRVSYRFLCDIFWDSHDPTNKDYLNFCLSTHYRSAIFYCNEEERKQAQQSKIRRQMKLNKRIVTKIVPLESIFYFAENQHQKYYLQKRYRVCESLSLRSTEQFVESNMACKLNGILGLDGEMIVDKLTAFLETNELPKQTKSACAEIVEDLSKN
ncbi:peptide methionine sulfoxide reductase [Manihot esculenta]|uniref:peptide-methionine (S)-S-oxide reductase n=1 Tax=Manihot esculenta TaxID=3983 RepID=A0A2C9WBL0_MANES|nr:peptide methionine sulfoxide reductase [Manihot esculenta]OAY57099.1 hypothetical protein MANES_02G070400v8 [Manihot esculenta]